MDKKHDFQSQARRAVDDLILAELFLVQAGIESASAINDGLAALGRRLSREKDAESVPPDSISDTLRSMADGAIEPYASRYRILRDVSRSRET